MNKKGIIFKKLLQIILIIIIIAIFASTVLNRQFYYDTIDFIQNLFEPPEVDPLPPSTRMLIEREKGFEYLQEWVNKMDSVMLTEQDYCYKEMNSTSTDSRRQEIAIIFTAEKEDSFNIKLQQKGATLSISKEINTPLCLIAGLSGSEFRSAEDTLRNFRRAFVDFNQQEIQKCLDNPSSCALMMSEIKTMSRTYNSYDYFKAEFQINSEERRAPTDSFAFTYQVSNAQGNTEEVMSLTTGKQSEAGYLIFKIKENICIMPMAQSSWIHYNIGKSTRSAGDLEILQRRAFYTGSFEKRESLIRLPECEINEVLTETQAKQELLQIINNAQDVKFKLTFNENPDVPEQKNSLEFEYKNNQWTINKEHPSPQINTNYINVTDETILQETEEHNILPVHDELKNIITSLRGRTKEQGNEYLLNYEHSQINKIEINEQVKQELIRVIQFRGPEIIQQEFN